jgi:hypothetical protein
MLQVRRFPGPVRACGVRCAKMLALAAVSSAAVGCALPSTASRARASSNVAESDGRTPPTLRAGRTSGATRAAGTSGPARAGSLYFDYAAGPVVRIRLDGPPWREETPYGSSGGFGLAIARNGDVYEAYSQVSGSGGGVAVLDKRRAVVRSIGLGTQTYALDVALDASGDTFVVCESVRKLSQFSIEVFAPGASGNATPLRTLAGAKTGMSLPTALALDPAGDLFVANASLPSARPKLDANGELSQKIMVFAPGAGGNEAPERVLAGADTGITDPLNIGLGADGNLYVANQTQDGYDVLVFAQSASGNVAPLWTLQSTPYGASLALGPGGELYLGPGASKNDGIAVFAPGASGNDAPAGFVGRHFHAKYPWRIALEHPWQ